MNMNRAAAAAHAEDMHGDHLLQGGHAILKEDTDPTGQDTAFSNVSHSAVKQSGLEGAQPGNLQGDAGARAGLGERMGQRACERHVSQADQYDK
ncbi:hypothetical protein LI328DRAFT_145917 [Trichoderma asperelloides]|nr:hypothetical protein LI328DRAFT_145917 [Trichoderma asperelloides]